MHHRRALAQHLPTFVTPHLVEQVAGDEAHLLRIELQRLEEVGGVHLGPGQGGDGADEGEVEIGEGARVDGVGGEHADQPPRGVQGAADAGVDACRRGLAGPGGACRRRAGDGEHAVEGVGQAAVAGEDHRAVGLGDDIQAGMVGGQEALQHGLAAEADGGLDDQGLAFEVHQRRGVVGNGAAQTLQQPGVAAPGVEGGGKVEGDGGENGQLVHVMKKYTMYSKRSRR